MTHMQTTIINIGREFGAGGLQIAGAIGSMLRIPVYDKELISKAAERSGFSREFFERRDEKKGFHLFQNILGMSRTTSLPQNFINDDDLFKIQSEVISEIAGKESAVFVGRAANYILRERECLDVFICAPKPDRIKRVSDRLGLTAEEAEEMIDKKERARSEFYNFFTFGEWGRSSDYDLCVNSSLLGIEGSARFIVDFGRSAGLIK